ncbi:MAG: hypothetical protein OEU54_17395 [Gemmatimonadota bacterium]|nr:hypothetical protein [Gemmatimonadota bacterium]
MKLKHFFVTLFVVVSLGACVAQTDFDSYRERIRVQGESLEVWMEDAQEWFQWLSDNADEYCPGCDPPGVPPDPPPPGDWS